MHNLNYTLAEIKRNRPGMDDPHCEAEPVVVETPDTILAEAADDLRVAKRHLFTLDETLRAAQSAAYGARAEDFRLRVALIEQQLQSAREELETAVGRVQSALSLVMDTRDALRQ